MVHQNFMLVPSFTIAENIVRGSEPRKGRFLDRAQAIAVTETLSKSYGCLLYTSMCIRDRSGKLMTEPVRRL